MQFKEHLIRAGSKGGVKAAQLLRDSINDLLPPELADNCPVMVRIYANVLGLSKMLARVQLASSEARSFSSFASSFTRAQELFDYVDAGDKKEGADYKIRGTPCAALFPHSITVCSYCLLTAGRNVPTLRR